MELRRIRPLKETPDETSRVLPTGGLRWIQVLAIAGLVVVAGAYISKATRSGAQEHPMRTAISEPGTTILPSVR